MNAHPIHMQVNSPELMKQHEEHKARRERLAAAARRASWFSSAKEPVDADAHVLEWKTRMEGLAGNGEDHNAHVLERRFPLGKDACSHVIVWNRLMRRPIDVDVLRLDQKLHPDSRAWEVVGSVRQIVNVVSEYYRVPQRDIISDRRTGPVVRARQISMYLAKTLTLRSLPEIGRVLGGKDHTTVLHGVRKITQRMADDAVLAKEIAELTDLISRRKA